MFSIKMQLCQHIVTYQQNLTCSKYKMSCESLQQSERENVTLLIFNKYFPQIIQSCAYIEWHISKISPVVSSGYVLGGTAAIRNLENLGKRYCFVWENCLCGKIDLLILSEYFPQIILPCANIKWHISEIWTVVWSSYALRAAIRMGKRCFIEIRLVFHILRSSNCSANIKSVICWRSLTQTIVQV